MDENLWLYFKDRFDDPSKRNINLDLNEIFFDYAEQYRKDFNNCKNISEIQEGFYFNEDFTGFVGFNEWVFAYFSEGFHRFSQTVHDVGAEQIFSSENYDLFKFFSRDQEEIFSFSCGFKNFPKEKKYFEKYMTLLENVPLKLSCFTRQGRFVFKDKLRGSISIQNEVYNGELNGKAARVSLYGGKHKKNIAQATFDNEEDLGVILNLENSLFDIRNINDFLYAVENVRLEEGSKFYNNYTVPISRGRYSKEESLKGLTFNEACMLMK